MPCRLLFVRVGWCLPNLAKRQLDHEYLKVRSELMNQNGDMYLSPTSIIDDPLGVELTVPGGLRGKPWTDRGAFPLDVSVQRLLASLIPFRHFDSKAIRASALQAVQEQSDRWLAKFREKAPLFRLEATWQAMSVSTAKLREVGALDEDALELFVNVTAWCFYAAGKRPHGGMFSVERIARATGLSREHVKKLIAPISFGATCPVCESSATGFLNTKALYSTRWKTTISCNECSHTETLVRRPDDKLRLRSLLSCPCPTCVLARASATAEFLSTYNQVIEECATALWTWTGKNLEDLYLHPQEQLSYVKPTRADLDSSSAYESAKALLGEKHSLREAIATIHTRDDGGLQCLVASGIGHGWLTLVGGRMLRGEEGHRAAIEFINHALVDVTARVDALRELVLKKPWAPVKLADALIEIHQASSRLNLTFMLPSLVTVKWSDAHKHRPSRV